MSPLVSHEKPIKKQKKRFGARLTSHTLWHRFMNQSDTTYFDYLLSLTVMDAAKVSNPFTIPDPTIPFIIRRNPPPCS